MQKKKFKNFVWYDLLNPTEEELRKFSSRHNLDYLLVHDILQAGHLPKHEKVRGYDFAILRAYSKDADAKENTINSMTNKISFFLSSNKLITVHRVEFPFINERMENSEFSSMDHAFYTLFADIISTYREPIEEQNQFVFETEKSVFLKNSDGLDLAELYESRSQARILRKLLLITEKVYSQFQVKQSVRGIAQDGKDLLLELNLQAGEINDDLNELVQVYLSLQAQKSNDVMQTLTIFSAFFLPLTFISGLYGMNFEFMPELKFKYGYFITLGIMISISFGIYFWFRMKRYLS